MASKYYYYPPLSKEEVLSVEGEEITVGKQREILGKISKRWDYIVNFCCGGKKNHKWWWDFLSGGFDDEAPGDYLGALNLDKDMVELRGHFSMLPPWNCDYCFPKRWAWENFEEEFNAEVKKEKEESEKELEKEKKTNRKKKEIKENIKKKLSKEEIKLIKFK